MKLKEIVIRRRRWGRANTGGMLYDSTTKRQCCLGFVCRAFGVPLSSIEGHGMPADIDAKVDRDTLPPWLLSETLRCDVDRAAYINDNLEIDEEEREAHIAAIFKRHGLRAVFKP